MIRTGIFVLPQVSPPFPFPINPKLINLSSSSPFQSQLQTLFLAKANVSVQIKLNPQLTLPDIMRCLITLETRPCEEPINFKVLLLPIQLSIIQSIRLLALPSNKGPRVGTAEQGNDSDTHSWEYYTNLCCKSSVQTLRREKKILINCRISEILPKYLIMCQNTEQKMLHMDPKILKCSTASDATRPHKPPEPKFQLPAQSSGAN